MLFSKRRVDGDLSDDEGFSPKSGSPSIDDDRRAHHNELERRRRDHIKDHFQALKNTIPLLEGEKSSRALILKRAVDYISLLQSQLKESKLEIEDQKRRNDQLRHHAAIGLINQSAAVVAQPQPQPSVFSLPSTTSAFSSTGASNFSATIPVLQNEHAAKQALLSSLLLQNLNQLIQPQTQHLTDFNGQNYLAAQQLAAQL
uniref:BHLH domain-containing protein n=1 Tax=Panagrolaimus sp. JU765 TaxID=591449 RepID=A0AC34QFT9_9BILA